MRSSKTPKGSSDNEFSQERRHRNIGRVAWQCLRISKTKLGEKMNNSWDEIGKWIPSSTVLTYKFNRSRRKSRDCLSSWMSWSNMSHNCSNNMRLLWISVANHTIVSWNKFKPNSNRRPGRSYQHFNYKIQHCKGQSTISNHNCLDNRNTMKKWSTITKNFRIQKSVAGREKLVDCRIRSFDIRTVSRQ